MDKIKHFYLKRTEDISGTSGTGIVARGVVLPDGQCVLQWLTFHSSTAIYKNIDDVEKIHGHNGKTLVIMGDPDDETKSKRRTRKSIKRLDETES